MDNFIAKIAIIMLLVFTQSHVVPPRPRLRLLPRRRMMPVRAA